MNVILIVIDSLRRDHIGAYGNPWIRTPNLDALVGESLSLQGAYPESGWTIPARRAIHTGLRSFPFDDWWRPAGERLAIPGWQPIPENQRTLAEMLSAEGYRTLLATDNVHYLQPSYNFQHGFEVFDTLRGQERDAYQPLWKCPPQRLEDSLIVGSPQQMRARLTQYFANVSERGGEEQYFPARLFTRAAELVEEAADRQPFLLMVDCFDPHEPWDPPQEYVMPYDGPYDGKEPHTPAYGDGNYLSKRELQRMHALYSGEVTLVDRWLGHLLDRMDELKLMKETLIVLLSDHGHAFGEHGQIGKPTHALWPELMDIPFLIRYPEGRRKGESIRYPASTHDVVPTVLGAVGVEKPSSLEGHDLSVLLNEDEPPPRPHTTCRVHDHVWTRDERYALICHRTGARPVLYDLQKDPAQRRDIATRKPGVARRMFEEYVLGDAGSGDLPAYEIS